MRAADFGVWRLLEELRERFPTFELPHGNGLAIVLTGPDPEPGLVALTELDGEQLAGLRSLFATLGNRVRCIGELQRSQRELGKVTRLEDRIRVLEDEVRALSSSRLVRLGRALRPAN